MNILKLKIEIMKKILVAILFAFTLLNCNSLSSTKTSNHFEKKDFKSYLKETLTAINALKSTEELHEYINKLKRLSALYPDEWLSDYYIAYQDINLSFVTTDKEKKYSLLKEAKETINSLKLKENIIESEIFTLNGYYYYALIAIDPQKNGHLYYRDVIGTYQKAISVDENNPRPALLLSIFKKRMAASVGTTDNTFCSELDKAEKLFENFTPISDLHPKWGEKKLKRYQDENCSAK